MPRYTLLFIYITLLLSCTNANKSDDSTTRKATPTAKQVPTSERPDAAKWLSIKSTLGLSSSQLNSLINIEDGFNAKVKRLKKKKKWLGKPNLPTRKRLLEKRKSDIRNVIGSDNYQKYFTLTKSKKAKS